MNQLDLKKRTQILSYLLGGNSIRATCRMTGAAKSTVTKLLAEVGNASGAYQDKAFRNLRCERLKVIAVRSFARPRRKNLDSAGTTHEVDRDTWTWTAQCDDTKLMVSWMVGGRLSCAAHEFIQDLSSRLASRTSFTSDSGCLHSAGAASGADPTHATLLSILEEHAADQRRKYSSSGPFHIEATPITNTPNGATTSSFYVEQQDPANRMAISGTHLPSAAFSKKLERLAQAVSLHFMYYNFACAHRLLQATPAMEAGISDHMWSLEEIAALADSPRPSL
jgi:hypothetical protein